MSKVPFKKERKPTNISNHLDTELINSVSKKALKIHLDNSVLNYAFRNLTNFSDFCHYISKFAFGFDLRMKKKVS